MDVKMMNEVKLPVEMAKDVNTVDIVIRCNTLTGEIESHVDNAGSEYTPAYLALGILEALKFTMMGGGGAE